MLIFRRMLRRAYREYRSSFRASEWYLVPPEIEFINYASTYINTSGTTTKPPSQDDAELYEFVYSHFISWHSDREAYLVDRFLKQEKHDRSLHPTTSPLGRHALAVDIFTCVSCSFWRQSNDPDGSNYVGSTLVGWEEVRQHINCERLSGQIFRIALNTTVLKKFLLEYLRILSLDHRTTEARVLDELDNRFACLTCPTDFAVGYRRYSGHRVYTWREFVSKSSIRDQKAKRSYLILLQARHLSSKRNVLSYLPDNTHDDVEWEILSPEMTDYVRVRESKQPYRLEEVWVCNHCPAYLDVGETFTSVSSHVQERSVIWSPHITIEILKINKFIDMEFLAHKLRLTSYIILRTARHWGIILACRPTGLTFSVLYRHGVLGDFLTCDLSTCISKTGKYSSISWRQKLAQTLLFIDMVLLVRSRTPTGG